MNQYKMAWQSHVDSDYSPVDNQDRREKESDSMSQTVTDHITDELIVSAAYVGLAYMATSHYGKLRIVGSVGLRLLPVIGIAAIGYSIYKLFD